MLVDQTGKPVESRSTKSTIRGLFRRGKVTIVSLAAFIAALAALLGNLGKIGESFGGSEPQIATVHETSEDSNAEEGPLAYPRIRVLVGTPLRKHDWEVMGLAHRGEEYQYTGRTLNSPQGNLYYEIRLGEVSEKKALVWAEECEIIGGPRQLAPDNKGVKATAEESPEPLQAATSATERHEGSPAGRSSLVVQPNTGTQASESQSTVGAPRIPEPPETLSETSASPVSSRVRDLDLLHFVDGRSWKCELQSFQKPSFSYAASAPATPGSFVYFSEVSRVPPRNTLAVGRQSQVESSFSSIESIDFGTKLDRNLMEVLVKYRGGFSRRGYVLMAHRFACNAAESGALTIAPGELSKIILHER